MRSDDLPRPRDLAVAWFKVDGMPLAVLSLSIPKLRWPSCLSLAERDVTQLLVEGRSAAMIARTRNRSRHTVVNQIRAVYRKLGVGSRAQLVHALTTDAAGASR